MAARSPRLGALAALGLAAATDVACGAAPTDREVTAAHSRASVAGRVTDGGGVGIPDAEVTIYPRDGRPEPESWPAATTVKTSDDGSFVFEGVRDGSYVVAARLWGIGRTQSRPAEAGAAEVAIVLGAVAEIEGRVVDEVTGAPIERFTLYLVSGDGKPSWMPHAGRRGRGELSTADGSFARRDVAPGRAFIGVAADGYVAEWVGPFDAKCGEIVSDVTVRLARAAIARGVVVDAETGEPIVGATAIARFPRPIDGGADLSHDASAETRIDGTFELLGLDRHMRFRVRHPLYVTSDLFEVDAADGEREIPAIALRRGGAIEGVALGRDVRRAPNAIVRATPEFHVEGGSRELMKSVETDANGMFRIEGLAVGRWSVTVAPSRKPFARGETRAWANVTDGETVRLAPDAWSVIPPVGLDW
ncbi:MAG TPA: carboxypeptidase-like regulatory domain-containing protein [Planctomycetota bacterium]|nr:carboxypeptidase-like regulatory domain-containing protein [Planctomycetota bacterium]